MSAVNFNMRLDSQLKAEAEAVLEDYGLSVPQALKLFLNQVVKTHAVPLSFDWGKTKQPTESPFNYDLARMQSMMAGLENSATRLQHGVEVPKCDSPEQTLAWLEANLPNSLGKDDNET